MLVAALVLGAIVASFLKVGLGTGSVLPSAQSGVTGGNGVGGGSAAVAEDATPPAPIQRLLTELKTRVARNPRDVAALVGLGDLYAAAGKFPQARPYYERALVVDPKNEPAQAGLKRTEK
jgi:cytochrome c-type biogenesis protein CcmH/NrfG